ncbi:dTDP-4-dehydrorhamnose 3,5-epimerase [Bacillus suaedaesalsae]|uniref:dTDP-4-dehydrorhamnose 3,5-epimerase n=1 Tax=Bacillus suaedaesalsae TaxID=2810349 RepID=A0ABS2DIC4_9BACI|nr:dTDP-4-dehydrorhamnose 3,5-epimerase [Bacillus suaedaesalsae]MBM6618244.1 dTDP-4-dehydrorhamnose 3,5-epimerase [Bacillus suaedaesalsae]
MKINETKFKGVYILEPLVKFDGRGFFMESYNKRLLEQNGIHYDFVQDNHSLSKEPGVVRGLHYQLHPMAQTKLVRVCTGAIYDVVVDIRPNSNTFGDWFGIILSEENKKQLLIPPGFAHGFCTLVPDTHLLYKVDQFYDSKLDRGILWNDPNIGIEWPISNPILSIKDQQLPLLKHSELNF